MFSPVEVARMALDLVTEFNKWNPEVAIKNKIPSCLNVCEQGVCTVQSGAGVFDDGTIAFGCVISDSGKIVLSACKTEAISPDIELAEMLAIRWSLNLP